MAYLPLGQIGHGPPLATKFFFYSKNIGKLGLGPLCANTSGQRTFGPPLFLAIPQPCYNGIRAINDRVIYNKIAVYTKHIYIYILIIFCIIELDCIYFLFRLTKISATLLNKNNQSLKII